LAKKRDFEVRTLSSLSKVFADEELGDLSVKRGSCLLGEVFSFQVAYRSVSLLKGIEVEVDSNLEEWIEVRSVGLAPAEMVGAMCDDNVLRTTPGLYPDPLFPIAEGCPALPDQWRSLWITVRVPRKGLRGKYDIGIRFKREGNLLASISFVLEVVPAALPPQKLIHTSWFHSDCIATRYRVEPWSCPHWELVEKFMQGAVDHGINMILTPIFTPPLDTQVGGERPTVQLVKVRKEGKVYSFDFSLLKKWIEIADRCGVKLFEISHLFTQWGAAHCPKIVALEKGKVKKIFGWKDSASGAKYRLFLDQFLPALIRFIDRQGIRKRCYFHVSDEPHTEHLESFAKAAEIVHRHLAEFPFIDALSSIEFYDRGLVKHPIPALNHIQPFLDRGIENLWTYYCVSQWNKVSNRFFNMPSARNRILGSQLYKFNLVGFLQWGFNFWYSQYSIREIDPFKVTDADKSFPAGDAFLVYPGEDGPIDSIRAEVFYEALQDQRALQLLEKLQGRDKTLKLLERDLDRGMTLENYPRDAAWILKMRGRINRKIGALVG
jgi:hypothetical protein